MTAAGSRDFDLVLLGATGFAGRLTAQHLARRASGVRVALAGRSEERLRAVRAELGPAAADWPLLTVDVSDDAAVTTLAARTRVVVTTVGPYLRYGLPLVKACAAAGTDYADLTGETLFVRLSIDACHERARATGARIVHSCGFDSVPSDLGVGLTAARAAADGHVGLGDAVLHVRSFRGGVSGGTVDSLRQQVLEVSDRPELRPLFSDPLSLTGPSPPPARPVRSLQRAVARDPRTGVWHGPFVMGGFNRQIVFRSDALTAGAYGGSFRYSEVLDTGRGLFGAAGAAALAAASAAVVGGMAYPPTRRLLDAVLPDPGQGPSERVRRRGRFAVEILAEVGREVGGKGGGKGSGLSYRTRFGAEMDPGYNATAVMLAESGLSLTVDDLPSGGGVLTPMTAIGEPLAARLRDQGFTIATEVATETDPEISAG